MKTPEGIGIEIAGLSTVGLFMAAIIPAYLWTSRAKTQSQVIERAAISATVLVAAAIYDGVRNRD